MHSFFSFFDLLDRISLFSICNVLLAISLAIVMATCLFCLFLYSRICPSIIGGWPRSSASVMQHMLH